MYLDFGLAVGAIGGAVVGFALGFFAVRRIRRR